MKTELKDTLIRVAYLNADMRPNILNLIKNADHANDVARHRKILNTFEYQEVKDLADATLGKIRKLENSPEYQKATGQIKELEKQLQRAVNLKSNTSEEEGLKTIENVIAKCEQTKAKVKGSKIFTEISDLEKELKEIEKRYKKTDDGHGYRELGNPREYMTHNLSYAIEKLPSVIAELKKKVEGQEKAKQTETVYYVENKSLLTKLEAFYKKYEGTYKKLEEAEKLKAQQEAEKIKKSIEEVSENVEDIIKSTEPEQKKEEVKEEKGFLSKLKSLFTGGNKTAHSLVRIAYENPELRKELLPLIAKIASSEISK
jgi:hypothetical protein